MKSEDEKIYVFYLDKDGNKDYQRGLQYITMAVAMGSEGREANTQATNEEVLMYDIDIEKETDTVLKSLNNDEQVQELHSEIKNRLLKLKPSLYIKDKDLQLILDKLCLDDNVKLTYGKTGGVQNSDRYYHITHKGKLFLKTGGYLSQSRKAQRIKIGNIIVKSITIIGVIIGAIYASVQIYKFYHCLCEY